jgi:hypothetical protein
VLERPRYDKVTRRLSSADLRHTAVEWLLPPAVKRTLLRAVRRAQSPRGSRAERMILATNARLQGAYAGRRCFVLGNGPSLAGVDIASLGGEITVVMNGFNQHPAIRVWQPVIHCVGEPAIEYTRRGGLGIEVLEALVSGYTTTIHVFPIELKPVFDRTGILPPQRLIFVKQDGRKAEDFGRIDLTGAIPPVNDTSILAVSVAIAMGCNPIVLLGLDYNWLSHQSIRTHFYEDGATPWPVEDLSSVPYLREMKTAIPRWEAHAALRRIAMASGQTILNATEGSFLDVYPTTTLRDVLARS